MTAPRSGLSPSFRGFTRRLAAALPRSVVLALVAGIGSTSTASAQESESYAVSRLGSLPLEAGASIWTRYEMRTGYEDLGVSRGRFLEGDWFVYRARFSLRTQPLELGSSGLAARVFFSPQADGFWGSQPSTVSTPNLGIYEGFLRLQSPVFRLDVGHFAMNYGDALVIGDLRWHQTARSFDGARVRLGAESWVDVFVTYLDEGSRVGLGGDPLDPLAPTGTGSVFGGDVWFTGIYASVGRLLGDGTTLEPYVLGQVWFADDAGAARPAVQATLGARALQKFGVMDLRLETGMQLGRRRTAAGGNPEVFAWHGDLEVGIRPVEGLRVSVEGLVASGDDPSTETVESWDELFPTTHKFLGLMDVIGIRSNVASGVLHGAYEAGPMTLELDVHTFFRLETVSGQSEYAGTEADVNAIYAISKEMTLRVLYAAFIPGSDHFFVEPSDTASDDPAHYVEVQYGLHF